MKSNKKHGKRIERGDLNVLVLVCEKWFFLSVCIIFKKGLAAFN